MTQGGYVHFEGAVFETDPETGRMVCKDHGRVVDPRAARIAQLEAEVAGWKRVAVEAVIPLEAMRMAGATNDFLPALRNGVDHAVAIVRRAVAGEGLPPAPALSTPGGTDGG